MLQKELKVLIDFFLYIYLIPCETQSPCLNGGICENNRSCGYTCACVLVQLPWHQLRDAGQ